MSAGPLRVEDLETPALLIDLDIMERNLERLADYARRHDLRLRPHTKTHKIPALARKQLDLGAVGLTVAKTTEAEVMLAAQPEDLLVAYPVIGRPKLERLMGVARQTRVTVSLDSLEAAQQLSESAKGKNEIGVLTEVDVGLGRVGVSPGEPLLQLVKAVSKLPGIRWEGIAFYPGHIKSLDQEGMQALSALAALLPKIVSDLERNGVRRCIVSGGSTPALFHSHELPGLNEIRPGTYIFNDRNTALMGACNWGDCAAAILTTVVSTARQGQVIIDGGSKTFSSDRPAAGAGVSFGAIVEAPDATFSKMNEEHGFVELGKHSPELRVGDRLRVIPNHVCVAMNLHEQVYGIRAGLVEQTWRVAGRGKLQ